MQIGKSFCCFPYNGRIEIDVDGKRFMATINALMKHLRDNGVQISGSAQKRKLRRIGYYHGYKGYRYAGTAANRLPISDFNQIVALYDFDENLKALFYGPVMSIETALKNRVLEVVLLHSKSPRFDDIYKYCLTAYRACGKKEYGKAWEKRLRLRAEMDSLVVRNHETRAVIRHFRDSDLDIPIWALFEVMTLGNFGAFYNCLGDEIKKEVCDELGLPQTSFNSPLALNKMIFALKDLRNAIAHNGVILDVRFKTASIHNSVKNLIGIETGVSDITFNEVTDYALLLLYMMSRLGFTKTECKQFLQRYRDVIEKYRALLPYNIYSQFVKSDVRRKLNAADGFIKKM